MGIYLLVFTIICVVYPLYSAVSKNFIDDISDLEIINIEISSKKKSKKSKTKKHKSKNNKTNKHDKKKKRDEDSELLRLLHKIDKKLDKGFVFKSMSRSHYERMYKNEILNLYENSELDSQAEQSLISILNSLLNDMQNPKKSDFAKLETKASIDSLNTMLKMDGVNSDFDDIVKQTEKETGTLAQLHAEMPEELRKLLEEER